MGAILNKAQAYKAVREEPKNTGDKCFSPKPKKTHDQRILDLESSLELFFDDPDTASAFEGSHVIWLVKAGDQNRPMTMNSVLFLDNSRVSSIDPQMVPLSFRYDNDTMRRGKYHMNIIEYDKNQFISNIHLELPDIKEYFTNIEDFARFAAQQWNIKFRMEDRLL